MQAHTESGSLGNPSVRGHRELELAESGMMALSPIIKSVLAHVLPLGALAALPPSSRLAALI